MGVSLGYIYLYIYIYAVFTSNFEIVCSLQITHYVYCKIILYLNIHTTPTMESRSASPHEHENTTRMLVLFIYVLFHMLYKLIISWFVSIGGMLNIPRRPQTLNNESEYQRAAGGPHLCEWCSRLLCTY